MTPTREEYEKQLDDIMEDLMVGHNFEYARKVILELRDIHVEQILKDVIGYDLQPIGAPVMNATLSPQGVAINEEHARQRQRAAKYIGKEKE